MMSPTFEQATDERMANFKVVTWKSIWSKNQSNKVLSIGVA